jgi:hypothetical protein
VSGSEETAVPVGGDDRIDVLARVTAALNTNLEGATAEMDRYHEELQAAQARIAHFRSTAGWSATSSRSNAVPDYSFSSAQETPLWHD